MANGQIPSLIHCLRSCPPSLASHVDKDAAATKTWNLKRETAIKERAKRLFREIYALIEAETQLARETRIRTGFLSKGLKQRSCLTNCEYEVRHDRASRESKHFTCIKGLERLTVNNESVSGSSDSVVTAG